MLKLCNIRRYKYILNNIFYKLLKLHNIESQYTLCNSCSKTIPCVFHRSRTSVSCTLFYQFCGVNRELQSRLLLGQEERQGNFRQNPRVLRRPVELHISSWSQNKHGGKNTLILFYIKDVKNQPGIFFILPGTVKVNVFDLSTQAEQGLQLLVVQETVGREAPQLNTTVTEIKCNMFVPFTCHFN